MLVGVSLSEDGSNSNSNRVYKWKCAYLPWCSLRAARCAQVLQSGRTMDLLLPPPPPALPPREMIAMPGNVLYLCPPWAPLLGFLGAAFALVFSNLGAAWGTGQAGRALSATGVARPDLTFKNIIPVVMAGVLGIYGLIVAVIIATGVAAFSAGSGTYSDYSLYSGFSHLCAGLTVGLCSLSCGICVGIAGDAGVRSVAEAPKHKPAVVTKLYVGMVLIQGTASALGMYGLIIALLMSINTSNECAPIY